MVVRGLKIKANAQYWPPTNALGELQRPVAVTKPTQLQLESPVVAARWAAREAFHKSVVNRHRSFKKAKRRESKSEERSSSASKSGARAHSESDTQARSGSADEWNQFRRAADAAATATSSQPKTAGSKKSTGGNGSASLKDSKSSASAVAKAGSVKSSKRKGKEAGLFEKPRWDTNWKIPKRTLPDTSVSSGGPSPWKSGKTKKPTKKNSKSNPAKGAQTQSERGSAPALLSTSASQAPDHWANHRPGDGTIPPHAELDTPLQTTAKDGV